MSDADFASLPKFDAHSFEPPAWAFNRKPSWSKTKNGESSTAADKRAQADASDSTESDEEAEIWQDAQEDTQVTEPWDAEFTTPELRTLLDKAVALKTKGNSFFTSKPPNFDSAIESYKEALKFLPQVANRQKAVKNDKPSPPAGSGIQEVTDEEATAIEAESKQADEVDPAEKERETVEDEIKECMKSCWGNIAACQVHKGDDKAIVEACTKALAIDRQYINALQRRAAANDRIGSWSSLTMAEEDYKLLIQLGPPRSKHAIAARQAMTTLPARLRVQQEKEKEEMMGKLKYLGNSLLGKFGLSTDMFKFDQQEGGGYNMRFER